MMTPMLKQARRFGRDLPVIWIRRHPPPIHKATDRVNGRSEIILLVLGRKPFAFVQHHFDLPSRSFAFLWLRDRRDELRAATALNNPLRGLTRVIEFPMS